MSVRIASENTASVVFAATKGRKAWGYVAATKWLMKVTGYNQATALRCMALVRQFEAADRHHSGVDRVAAV